MAGFAVFGTALIVAALTGLALVDTFAVRLFANVLSAAWAVWTSFAGFGRDFEVEVMGSAFVAGFAVFGLALIVAAADLVLTADFAVFVLVLTAGGAAREGCMAALLRVGF